MSFLHSLEICGCRVFQAVFKICDYAVPYRLPEYIEGAGSILRLPGFLKEKAQAINSDVQETWAR